MFYQKNYLLQVISLFAYKTQILIKLQLYKVNIFNISINNYPFISSKKNFILY